MVRYMNAEVTILAESTTENADGDIITSYSPVETIKGDVQPAALTDDEIKLYGISTSRGNVKKFFYNGIHSNVKAGNRASVQSALSGTTDIYSIMPVNCWPNHGCCLLVPVENEGIEENGNNEG